MRDAGEAWEEAPVFGEPSRDPESRIRPSAYALISDGAGRIAVVRAPDGVYLPGGGIEAGEEVEDALRREALEECGFHVRPGSWTRRAVQFARSASERAHFEKRSTFVECSTGLEAPSEPLEPDHELLWLEPAAARRVLTHESHAWAIDEWLRERRSSE